MIDKKHKLPLSVQCRLLDLSRSSTHYRPSPVSEKNLLLMRLIDEIHLKYPFYGSRRIRGDFVQRTIGLWLIKDMGYNVGRQRVVTPMRKMNISALYQKPRLSKPHPGHKIYPYLLRNVDVTRANQV